MVQSVKRPVWFPSGTRSAGRALRGGVPRGDGRGPGGEGAFESLERVARSHGAAIMLAWAFSEATFWPIMPDFALAPLAAARPTATAELTFGTSVGVALGGAVTYGLARWAPERATRQPLVTPRMRGIVIRWLGTEGPRGVLHQPLSFVPYKAFAREAGARRLPLVPFLAWSLLARGARFGVVGILGVLVGTSRRPLLRRHFASLAVLYALLFAVGLWTTVRRRS